MTAAFSSGKSRKLWPHHLNCCCSGGGSAQVGRAVRVEGVSFDLVLTRKLLGRHFFFFFGLETALSRLTADSFLHRLSIHLQGSGSRGARHLQPHHSRRGSWDTPTLVQSAAADPRHRCEWWNSVVWRGPVWSPNLWESACRNKRFDGVCLRLRPRLRRNVLWSTLLL